MNATNPITGKKQISQKELDAFYGLSSLEEKIGKYVQKDIEIKQQIGAIASKEAEIRGLYESVANQQIRIEELKTYINNSNERIASGEMSTAQYLALKKELAEKEIKLQGLNELIDIHNNALPLMRDDLNARKSGRDYFTKNIAKLIFDEKIDEIVNDVGEKLLTLINTTPLIDSFLRELSVGHNGHYFGHEQAIAKIATQAIIVKVLDGKPVPDQNSGRKYIEGMALNIAKSHDKYGKVTAENGVIVTIAQQPYIEGIPEYSYYKAAGIDSDCNEYVIQWDCVAGWQDIEDEAKRYNFDEYYIKAV